MSKMQEIAAAVESGKVKLIEGLVQEPSMSATIPTPF